MWKWANGGTVGWGTSLQAGRSWVRLEFFIYIILSLIYNIHTVYSQVWIWSVTCLRVLHPYIAHCQYYWLVAVSTVPLEYQCYEPFTLLIFVSYRVPLVKPSPLQVRALQMVWLCILTVCLCMTTLTEVFPCFFLSCKANARAKTRKDGARPALFLVVLLYVFFVLFYVFLCSLYCLFCDVSCISWDLVGRAS